MDYRKQIGVQKAHMVFLPVGTDGVLRGTCTWTGRGLVGLTKEDREAYVRWRMEIVPAALREMGLDPAERRRMDIVHANPNPAAGRAAPRLRQ